MLQRQIIKAIGKQIEIEDPLGTKYAITSFDYIAKIFISIIVTINRTAPIQRLRITTTARSSIKL
jgi:hypothetical protein